MPLHPGTSPSIPSPYKTQRKKVKALVTCCTMVIALTTVWLVGLVVSYADARLPPKFLKATNNVGKIYAGRYGYSLVPTAPKLLVQASVDRKVVHVPVPVMRPVRRKRRPFSRRPPAGPPEYGFQDYATSASKQHPRLRRPPKYRSKPRPPPRETDYYEQEVEDDPEDFNDYDYEDKRLEKQKRFEDRPLKRGYSSSSNNKSPYEETRPKPTFSDSRYNKRPFEEEEEFFAQHSDLYASGYPSGKPKSRPTRTRDDDEPPRKSMPFSKGSRVPTRPTNKLYSASFPPPRRPPYLRDQERYRYEEEQEAAAMQRPRYKKKPRYPEEDYDDTSQEKEVEQDKETVVYRPGSPPEEYEYNPDNFYHDRKYEPKQKAKRGTEDKEGSRPRQQRPNERDEEQRPFVPSESSDDPRTPERKEPPPRRNKAKTRVHQEESYEKPKSTQKTKWSIPYRLEDEHEEWDHSRETGTSEKPQKQQENFHELVTSKPKKTEEKPVNEHATAQSSWPVIVQGLNWKDAPHPAYVENHPGGFMTDWQDFRIPQWPNMDEQLGQLPESLRSTFKWVEPTNQTPLHPTVAPPHHKTTTKSPIVVPPEDYPSRGTGQNNEPRKKKNSRRGQKDRNRNGNSDIVAQRVVGGTLQLNAGAFKPDQTHSEAWANPAHQSPPGRSPQQQYTVEMFKSIEPRKPFDGEIVYGTRISDTKSKLSSIEPDIGYHSGMETVDDDIGGWQVY